MISSKVKELITQKITNVEKQSSCELICVLANSSINISFYSFVMSLCFCTFVSFFVAIFSHVSLMYFFGMQILFFLMSYFILQNKQSIIFKILPKKYLHDKAKKFAHEKFKNYGFSSIKSQKAVMFFVSTQERYVEIITGEGVCNILKDEIWEEIIKNFIKDVKEDKIPQAFLNAIEQSSQILIDNFPILEDDIDEITRQIIQI